MLNLSGRTSCVAVEKSTRTYINFCSNEDIQVVHEDIKDQLKDAHHRFFTEIQSMITLVGVTCPIIDLLSSV